MQRVIKVSSLLIVIILIIPELLNFFFLYFTVVIRINVSCAHDEALYFYLSKFVDFIEFH